MSTNQRATVAEVEAAKWDAAAERALFAAELAERDGVEKAAVLALAERFGADFLAEYLRRRRAA
jgi:hypothetical protein